LFPYTTLFRSKRIAAQGVRAALNISNLTRLAHAARSCAQRDCKGSRRVAHLLGAAGALRRAVFARPAHSARAGRRDSLYAGLLGVPSKGNHRLGVLAVAGE